MNLGDVDEALHNLIDNRYEDTEEE